MNRLVVRHWIACLETQFEFQTEWVHPYNLLGVSYSHALPADAEFPCVIPRLEMFARFFHGRDTRAFEVEVYWTDGPNGPVFVDSYGPYTVFFARDRPARSYVFRVQNIPLPGAGRYQIGLKMIEPRRNRWLATEFFEVIRWP